MYCSVPPVELSGQLGAGRYTCRLSCITIIYLHIYGHMIDPHNDLLPAGSDSETAGALHRRCRGQGSNPCSGLNFSGLSRCSLLRSRSLSRHATLPPQLCIRVSRVFHFWKGIATMETIEHRAMFLSHC